jgi:predicted nucleic-acid-binding protein
MIGLDTNVLARYYVEDQGDAESMRQRVAARGLIESGNALMVCKTVVLEFEWVLRGYYGYSRRQIVAVLSHLLSLPHVTIEDRLMVERSVERFESGFDFADVLHHASYRDCKEVASFDDRNFVRRARNLRLTPPIKVPG